MSKQQNSKRLLRRRVGLIALIGVLVLSMFKIAVVTLADTEVQPPSKDSIFIYNNNNSMDARLATAYILTNGEDTEATYKVYSAAGVLLGQGKQYLRDGYCAVPLYDPDKPYTNGSIAANVTLYVTRTVDGVESARVAVKSGAKASPNISLGMAEVNAAKKLPTRVYGDSSGFLGNEVYPGTTLTEGSFYQVQVRLEGFAAIDAVLIPLRYDTSILKPASIAYSSSLGGNKLSAITDEKLEAAAGGLTFAMGMIAGHNSSLTYGITPGMAFQEWYKGDEAGTFSTPTEGGAYQSINTTTGLIKLQASIKTPAPFGHPNFTPASTKKSGTNQFVRFFFQAAKTVTLEELPVWFATEADCPEEVKDSPSLRLSYYDPASPNGISVTLSGASVMMPPLPLAAVDEPAAGAETASVVTLTADKLGELPEPYSFFTLYANQLNKDEVKVYNYTNSGITYLHQLDGFDAYDRLIIEQSKAIRYGDTIRAYRRDGTDFVKIGEATAELNAPVVVMNLGTDRLDPYGGNLYVTVERGTNGESPRVEVPYLKEATRDVTFSICRSDWDEEHDTISYNRNTTDMRAGTLLQFRVYFNNFTDLSSYGFAIHFDPRAVKVADAEYAVVDSGTVREEDYANGVSCFSPGADLTDVTLTEQVIYQTAQSGNEEEIEQLLTELDLTRAEFDAIVTDVQLKYSVGVDNGTQEIPWRGGLLFTKPRDDNTSFPYVDNENGLVQFMSASLDRPTVIGREDGYHFISINFLVVNSYMDPGFRFATDSDTHYCPVMNKGYQVVMSGGEPDLGINTHWEVAPMGTRITMTLADGNSNDPASPKTVYLYQGAAYRDPGFSVKLATGQGVSASQVERYYVDANDRNQVQNPELLGKRLPVYEEEENIADFVISDSSYSAHYILYYEYVTQNGSNMVQMTRDIYVIYQKGDINRDGDINVFDEQFLSDCLHGYAALPLEGILSAGPYLQKTVDVNGDGVYGDDADREEIRLYNLGLVDIQQDYIMPAGP